MEQLFGIFKDIFGIYSAGKPGNSGSAWLFTFSTRDAAVTARRARRPRGTTLSSSPALGTPRSRSNSSPTTAGGHSHSAAKERQERPSAVSIHYSVIAHEVRLMTIGLPFRMG